MNKIQKEALSIIDRICKYQDIFAYVHKQIIISSVIICILFISTLWFNSEFILSIILTCMCIEILSLVVIIYIISEMDNDFINTTSVLTDKEYLEVFEEAQANNKWNKMLGI